MNWQIINSNRLECVPFILYQKHLLIAGKCYFFINNQQLWYLVITSHFHINSPYYIVEVFISPRAPTQNCEFLFSYLTMFKLTLSQFTASHNQWFAKFDNSIMKHIQFEKFFRISGMLKKSILFQKIYCKCRLKSNKKIIPLAQKNSHQIQTCKWTRKIQFLCNFILLLICYDFSNVGSKVMSMKSIMIKVYKMQ